MSHDRLLDTVDKLNCHLQWPGEIGFISVLNKFIKLNSLSFPVAT